MGNEGVGNALGISSTTQAAPKSTGPKTWDQLAYTDERVERLRQEVRSLIGRVERLSAMVRAASRRVEDHEHAVTGRALFPAERGVESGVVGGYDPLA